MATTYQNALQQLYVAYFNRPADPAGLAWYEAALEASADPEALMADISATFAASDEYQDEYADMTNAEVVTQVYMNLFGREPEAAGLAWWVDALSKGNTTIDKMVTDVAAGALDTDAEAFEAKVLVATEFTTKLSTGTEADIAAFNTEEGLAAAKDLISTIETEEDAAAAIVPATLAASVAAVVDAGTPFTLAGGLAKVLAAYEAKSDLLADLAEDEAVAEELGANDDPTDTEILAAITAVNTDAKAAIDAIIPTYSNTTTSAAMRSALLSDKTTALNTALKTATTTLGDAEEAVGDVDGLGAAIAAYQNAAEEAVAANKAAGLASTAETAAVADLGTLNGGTAVNAAGEISLTVDGVTSVVIEYDATAEEWVLAEDVSEDDVEGVTATLNALNAKLAAVAAAAAADAAAEEAAIAADILDASDEGELLAAVAASMQFTSLDEDEMPTYEMILGEQAIFADKIDALDEVAGGAGAYATAMTDLAADVAALTAGDAAGLKLLTDAAVTAGYITTADATAIKAAFVGTTATPGTPADGAAAVEANSWLARSDAFTAAVDALLDAEALEADIGALTTDLEDAQLGVETAAGNIEALNDAVAEYNASVALLAAVKTADGAIATATKVLTDEGFAAPVATDSTIVLSTAKDDIFLVGSQDDVSLRSFGLLGQDTLYVGTELVYNDKVIGSGTGEVDLEDAGNNAALEFFLRETATGVDVVIENKAYGSETGADGDLNIITLVGVDLEDVTVANGFITVGTPTP